MIEFFKPAAQTIPAPTLERQLESFHSVPGEKPNSFIMSEVLSKLGILFPENKIILIEKKPNSWKFAVIEFESFEAAINGAERINFSDFVSIENDSGENKYFLVTPPLTSAYLNFLINVVKQHQGVQKRFIPK